MLGIFNLLGFPLYFYVILKNNIHQQVSYQQYAIKFKYF